MKRRQFIALLGGTAATWPLAARAQQAGKIPTIGVLSPFNDAENTLLADLKVGLREYGYVDGQSIKVEYRSAEGRLELLPGFAADLVARNVDLIVTSSAPAIQVARQATKKIPIVFARVGDAVNQGIVTSLSRPGGNITGISWFAPELSGKSLEVLREAFPTMSHVAIFREAAAGAASAMGADTAARRLGIKSTLFQDAYPRRVGNGFRGDGRRSDRFTRRPRRRDDFQQCKDNRGACVKGATTGNFFRFCVCRCWRVDQLWPKFQRNASPHGIFYRQNLARDKCGGFTGGAADQVRFSREHGYRKKIKSNDCANTVATRESCSRIIERSRRL